MRPSVPRPAVALLGCFTLAAALLAGLAFAAKPGGSVKPAAPGTVNAPPKTSAASAPPAAPTGPAALPAASLAELADRYDSSACRDCHQASYAQWERSQHARPLMGIKNDIFLKKYLTDGPFAPKQGEAGGKANLGCLHCHLPQIAEASEAAANEIVQAVRQNDKERVGRLQITCLVCHGRLGVVHGKPEPGVIYGSRDLPEHPGRPVKASGLLKDSLHCGQCHGLGPVLNEGRPMQCATLYGSWLHAYVPRGGTKSCQDCHIQHGDHTMAPVFGDREATAALYREALPLEVEAKAYTFRRHGRPDEPKAVLVARIGNRAGHRLPDG